MRVSEVMNKAMVIEESVTLKQAAKIMGDKKIGSLIIMNKDSVTGILTDSDVTRNAESLGRKVSQIMSKNVITIGENEDLNQAARLMSENKIKRLPVISKGNLVGIITASDIMENSDALNEDFLIE